jgi:hypothetical protein
MWNRVFVAATVAILLLPAAALADKESDCQNGIATLKSELKKKHPKPVQDQLRAKRGRRGRLGRMRRRGENRYARAGPMKSSVRTGLTLRSAPAHNRGP